MGYSDVTYPQYGGFKHGFSEILASNYDVYKYDGVTLFFQAPPTLSLWMGEMRAEVQIQAETITIVAVFCLASLVGLTLLSRKLRIFLPS